MRTLPTPTASQPLREVGTKVLMIDGSDRGGIARYTDELVRRLVDLGVDVRLAAPGARATGAPPIPATRWGEETASWSRARLLTIRAGESIRRARAVLRAVKAVQPTVVHLQTPVAARADRWLIPAIQRRAPVVVTVHNAIAHDGPSERDRTRWLAADLLVVHGETARAVVESAAPGRIVRSVPVDLLHDRHAPDRPAARSMLGIDASAPIALMLGLLRPYKGLGLVADAWPAVRDALPGARLFVVGSAPRTFDDLSRISALAGVDVRIGWEDDETVLACWAAAANVLLLPYEHGAHSGVLHQAVGAGTPVIASPPLAEEVERFSAGRVVTPEPGAWAAALIEALGSSPLPPPRRPDQECTAAATLAVYEEARQRWTALGRGSGR